MRTVEQARLDVLEAVNERRLESLDEYVELVILLLTVLFFLINYFWIELSYLVDIFSLTTTVIVFFFYKYAKALHAIDLRLFIIFTFAQLLAISLLMFFSIPIYFFVESLEITPDWITTLIMAFYLSLIVFLEEIGNFVVSHLWVYIQKDNFEVIENKVLYLTDRMGFNFSFFYILAFVIMIYGLTPDEFFVGIASFILIPMLFGYFIYKYYRYRKLTQEVLINDVNSSDIPNSNGDENSN